MLKNDKKDAQNFRLATVKIAYNPHEQCISELMRIPEFHSRMRDIGGLPRMPHDLLMESPFRNGIHKKMIGTKDSATFGREHWRWIDA